MIFECSVVENIFFGYELCCFGLWIDCCVMWVCICEIVECYGFDVDLVDKVGLFGFG